MAKVTKKCDKVTGRDMKSFLSCTLVPLEKNPGVLPIGIGEVLRRIVGKSITTSLKKDIQDAAGICVHTMAEIFEDDTITILLMDTSNAFDIIFQSFS